MNGSWVTKDREASRRGRGLRRLLSALLVTFAFFGCVAAAQATSSRTVYTLDTGDRLRVTVYGQKDLSGDFEVGIDGSVALPLVGNVAARGLDASGLAASIENAYRGRYLINPRVSIEVTEYRPFFIVGNVQQPGAYNFAAGLTVIKAIALAGGFLVTRDDLTYVNINLTRAREEYGLAQRQYLTKRAEEAQLIAERDDLDDLEFPQELFSAADDPEIARILSSRRSVFLARKKEREGQLSLIKKRSDRLAEEINALKAQQGAAAKQVALLEDELTGLRKLLKKGFARKSQVLALERRLAEIDGERGQFDALIARAGQDLASTELELSQARNQDMNDIAELEDRVIAARAIVEQNEVKRAEVTRSVEAQSSGQFVITREIDGALTKLGANEATLVLPGDVIDILGGANLASDSLGTD